MIRFSNGHSFAYMIPSGALAYGEGYPWEWPLIAAGLIKRELFTIVCKTVTWDPLDGYFRWWKPGESIRLLPGGSDNMFGLRNPGFNWFCRKIGSKADLKKIQLIASIQGTGNEMVKMAHKLNDYDFVAVELDLGCMNTGHSLPTLDQTIALVTRVVEASRHPVIIKVSVAQNYLAIAQRLKGLAEAIALNSVPWDIAFSGKTSPLHRLQQRVGGCGGGVSGKPAQECNWRAVKILADDGSLPVIAPSITEFGDLLKVKNLGAEAASFGAIHLPSYPFWKQPWTLFTNPCKPTEIVMRDLASVSTFH